MDSPWRIELFGGLRVTRGERAITRFRRQKAWSLLAYLSYYPHQSHPRDELIELLWPEIDPETGRSNLRVTLYSIRQQLDARDDPTGSILINDQGAVSLDPAAFTTDVAEFEAALRTAA
jgi:DNA-binding SARP family transcriptional activator